MGSKPTTTIAEHHLMPMRITFYRSDSEAKWPERWWHGDSKNQRICYLFQCHWASGRLLGGAVVTKSLFCFPLNSCLIDTRWMEFCDWGSPRDVNSFKSLTQCVFLHCRNQTWRGPQNPPIHGIFFIGQSIHGSFVHCHFCISKRYI